MGTGLSTQLSLGELGRHQSPGKCQWEWSQQLWAQEDSEDDEQCLDLQPRPLQEGDAPHRLAKLGAPGTPSLRL